MIRSFVAPLMLIATLAALPLAAQEAPRAPNPDELRALSYYIQQNDSASTQAELRRLQLKYPGWQPPTDLGKAAVTGPSTEIDAIYRAISAERYDEARRLIASTRSAYPTWVPPSEMTGLLATAEGQKGLDAALSQGDVARATALGREVPQLLRCDRINNAWRLAEAQSASGNRAEAMAIYRSVLRACTKPADLIATLEKVDSLATPAELTALIDDLGTRLPAMQNQLGQLRTRLLAGRGVVNTPAAPTTTTPSAPATHQQAARPAAPSVPEAAGQSGDWAQCLQQSAGSRTPNVLYQRGWCAYNLDQTMEAVNAFRSALAGRLDSARRRDAHYGLALSYLKLQMPEEAAQIAASIDFTRKQRVDIERQILDQRGVAAYKRKQYRQAVAYFNAMEEVSGGIRRDLAILRAYALLNMGERDAARREFERLNSQMSTLDTRRGLEALQ